MQLSAHRLVGHALIHHWVSPEFCPYRGFLFFDRMRQKKQKRTLSFYPTTIMMRTLVRVSEQLKTLSKEETHNSTLCHSEFIYLVHFLYLRRAV